MEIASGMLPRCDVCPVAETDRRGFHRGLSLIRGGSLIPSHLTLWRICIQCHRVMGFFFFSPLPNGLLGRSQRRASNVHSAASKELSDLLRLPSRAAATRLPRRLWTPSALRRFREEKFRHCEDSRRAIISYCSAHSRFSRRRRR